VWQLVAVVALEPVRSPLRSQLSLRPLLLKHPEQFPQHASKYKPENIILMSNCEHGNVSEYLYLQPTIHRILT
jgi:hypothetical protein